MGFWDRLFGNKEALEVGNEEVSELVEPKASEMVDVGKWWREASWKAKETKRKELSARVEVIWAEKGWSDELLPEPPSPSLDDSWVPWPPEVLGALFVRYARAKQLVAEVKVNLEGDEFWDRLNFVNAHVTVQVV